MLTNHFSLLSILKTIFAAYNFCENCETPQFGVNKKKLKRKEKLNNISTKNIKQKTVFNMNNNNNNNNNKKKKSNKKMLVFVVSPAGYAKKKKKKRFSHIKHS